MKVSAKQALVKADGGRLLFKDVHGFSQEEQAIIDEMMDEHKGALEVYQEEAAEAGLSQLIVQNLDKEIKGLQEKLRETPEYKALQQKKHQRKQFLAKITASLQRMEGAVMSVFKNVRKGTKRFEVVKAFYNTRQLTAGKDGE